MAEESHELDMDSVVPFEDLDKHDEVDAHFLAILSQAEADMIESGLVSAVHERYFGLGIPELIAIYLIRFTPAPSGEDEWSWYITSRVNNGLFNVEMGPNPIAVLDGYIELMTGLAEHVLNDPDSDKVLEQAGLPPFDQERAAEMIELLEEIQDVLESQFGEDDETPPSLS